MALNWFRIHKYRWATFVDFVRAWRERFRDPDYQFNLYEEIRQRSQHPKERVADYLTAMKCLLDRVDPVWSEAKQLEIAVRNMVPWLQLRLPTVTTWTQQEWLSVRLERTYLNTKNFKKPPKLEESMFPNLAYKETPSKNPYRKTMANLTVEEQGSDLEDELLDPDDPFEELALLRKKFKKSANFKVKPSTSTDPSTPLSNLPVSPKARDCCFNCGENGHFLSNCNKPRRVFCRSCGKRGVYKTNCPTCSANYQYCLSCGLVGYNSTNCPECKPQEN